VRLTGAPDGSRNVAVTLAGTSFGLAISTNVSKKPVAPSAKNHWSDGLVTPTLSWPAANVPVADAYIARSTMIGTAFRLSSTAETSVAASPGCSSTGMVARVLGATSISCSMGSAPPGSR
jgi:hypothetical protein